LTDLLLQQKRRTEFSQQPQASVIFWPTLDLVLAVALEFERAGSAFVPHARTESTLDPGAYCPISTCAASAAKPEDHTETFRISTNDARAIEVKPKFARLLQFPAKLSAHSSALDISSFVTGCKARRGDGPCCPRREEMQHVIEF
jgi:hypothetical protein